MGSVAEHQAEVLVWEQFRGIPRWLAVLLCVGLTCSYVAAVYVPQFLLSTFRYFWRGPSSSPGLQARARLDRGCDTPAACCSSSSETVQSHTRRLPNSDRQLGCAGRFTHSQRPAVQSPAGRSAGAWRACGVAQPASASSSSRPTRAPLPNEPVEICLVSSACRSVDAGCDLAHGSRRGSPSRRRQPSPLADRTQAPMVSSEEDDRSPLPPGFLGFPPSAELHPHQLLPPRSAEVDGRKREASSSPAGAWGSDGEGHSEGGRRPTESARTRIDGRMSEGASLAGSSGACRVSAGDAGGIEELSDNLVDHLLRDFSAVDCCSGSAVVSRTLALLLHSVGAVGVCLFLCLRLGLTNTGGCEGAAPDGQLHGAGSGTPPEASRSSGGTSHSDAGGLRDSRGANLGLDEPNLRRWAPAGMLSFLLVSFGLPQAEEGADWLSPSLVSLKLLLALYGPSLVVRTVPPLLVAAKRLRSASLCAAASCAPTSVRAPPQPSAPGGGDTHRYKAARPQFCRQSDTARSFLSAPHGQMEGQLLEVEGDRRYQGEAKTGTVMGDVGVSSGSPAQQLVCADGGGSTVVKPMTGKHHQGNKRCEGDSCLLSGGSNDGYKQHTLEIPEGLASLTSDIREGFWPFVRACVVAPVVEEFLFRGVFVALLAGHIGCLGTCAGVSILFALAHIHHFVLSVVADAYEQDLPVPRPLGMNSDEKNCAVRGRDNSCKSLIAGRQMPAFPSSDDPSVAMRTEKTECVGGSLGSSTTLLACAGEKKGKNSPAEYPTVSPCLLPPPRGACEGAQRYRDSQGMTTLCFSSRLVGREGGFALRRVGRCIQVAAEAFKRAQKQLLLTFAFSWACTYLHLRSVNFRGDSQGTRALHTGGQNGMCVSHCGVTSVTADARYEHSGSPVLALGGGPGESGPRRCFRGPALLSAIILHAGCNLLQLPDAGFLYQRSHPLHKWASIIVMSYGAAVAAFTATLAAL